MNSEKEYQNLVEAIFERFPSVQKDGFSAGAYKPGLERMEAFDKALGCPSKAFRSVHIAGTNGKGSVASMLTAALSAVGAKVGLYTSPHLLDFRERARIVTPEGASLIDKDYVRDFLTQWQPYFDKEGLSFFEITTGLAFNWFADSKVDIAIIETGLGGRLDSTNIITPVLSIITSIGLDHCALLGDTRAKIAAEKAGIMKPGVPCLVGEEDDETGPVLRDHAWMLCPLSFADEAEPRWWYRSGEILQSMDLRGPYQKKNLRTALAALDLLEAGDMDTAVQAIKQTARRTHFHGRWERLLESPEVICDIGHNPPALKENFAALEAECASGRPLTIVFGVMADKDLGAIIPLMPTDATYIFTRPDTPRAMAPEEILRQFTAAGRSTERAYLTDTVREAVDLALRTTRSYDAAQPLVYIGGSTFVVADALKVMGKHSF